MGFDAPAVGVELGLDRHRALGELGRDLARSRDDCGHGHRLVGELAAARREEGESAADSAGPVALAGGAGGDPEMEAGE